MVDLRVVTAMELRESLHIILRFAVLAVTLAVPVASLSQDMELVKPGPLGRPMMVRDEGDNWAIPISVYSDDDIELFVSENLTLAGVYWDGPKFKKDGFYETYIYSFYKNDHDCRRHRIPAGHTTDTEMVEGVRRTPLQSAAYFG
jgi:hypothetical protein